MSALPLKVAVVGSGPAGFYAADALLKSEEPIVEVDCSTGCRRRGGSCASASRPTTRTSRPSRARSRRPPRGRASASSATSRSARPSRHDELLRLYDAVVYTVGAQTDRRLGIPGEDLPGSWAATEFVAWYNGHPDFQDCVFDLSHERAVVIGNGNVAIDCARMLALTAEELAPTDTTPEAIEAICGAGRRGDRDARPARARCRPRSRRRS